MISKGKKVPFLLLISEPGVLCMVFIDKALSKGDPLIVLMSFLPPLPVLSPDHATLEKFPISGACDPNRGYGALGNVCMYVRRLPPPPPEREVPDFHLIYKGI